MTPKIRQWLYTVSAIASALIPLLVTYKVLDPTSGSAWVNLIGILGVLGTGGAATAAVVTARQRQDGTLDFTGTPAQQAIEAIQATVAQATTAASDLDRVRSAVTDVLSSIPVLGDVFDAVARPPAGNRQEPSGTAGDTSDPASANYQP
jgi:hypothetical protein